VLLKPRADAQQRDRDHNDVKDVRAEKLLYIHVVAFPFCAMSWYSAVISSPRASAAVQSSISLSNASLLPRSSPVLARDFRRRACNPSCLPVYCPCGFGSWFAPARRAAPVLHSRSAASW